jgi:hypothetical protein
MGLETTHIDKGIARIDEGVAELMQTVTKSKTDAADIQALRKRTEVINWLATTSPSLNHIAASKKHQPGTGRWFVEGSCMESWKKPNSMLWLHGIRKQYNSS